MKDSNKIITFTEGFPYLDNELSDVIFKLQKVLSIGSTYELQLCGLDMSDNYVTFTWKGEKHKLLLYIVEVYTTVYVHLSSEDIIHEIEVFLKR